MVLSPDDSVERLHEWMYDLASRRERNDLERGRSGAGAEILDESFKYSGAVVVGRRMFDVADGWEDDPHFHMPVFVVAHDARERLVREGERR